jgi:hypothetical protein
MISTKGLLVNFKLFLQDRFVLTLVRLRKEMLAIGVTAVKSCTAELNSGRLL